MKLPYLQSLFLIVLIQGCATKQIVVPSQKSTQAHIRVQELNEEDTDNFDEEYIESTEKSEYNPFNGYNRVMTSFNDKLFINFVNPLSKGSATIVPEVLRLSISNFIYNIESPIRFTNNILQGKFKNSSDELERFIINTTVGIAGFFNPASTYMHIPTHNEDFGQTLGYYGIGAGYHVVLPFLGPSNIRDILGLVGDGFLSPLMYDDALKRLRLPKNYIESASIYSLKMINKNASNLGAYESLKKDAIDLYPFLKDIYEQKRTADIQE